MDVWRVRVSTSQASLMRHLWNPKIMALDKIVWFSAWCNRQTRRRECGWMIPMNGINNITCDSKISLIFGLRFIVQVITDIVDVVFVVVAVICTHLHTSVHVWRWSRSVCVYLSVSLACSAVIWYRWSPGRAITVCYIIIVANAVCMSHIVTWICTKLPSLLTG